MRRNVTYLNHMVINTTYRYEGIDQKTADGLGSAESKGRFLHSHVIGKFDATKI
jgi:hypothetical protein